MENYEKDPYLSRDEALSRIKYFKQLLDEGKIRFDPKTEAFLFELDFVRDLVKHPKGKYFLIRLACKQGEDTLSPILCVADEDNSVLDPYKQKKTIFYYLFGWIWALFKK